MKGTIHIILIILVFFAHPVLGTELKKISRVDSKDIIQLFFNFDSPPRFSSNADNKRIDLIFHDTDKLPDLKLFLADENIVKILSREIKGKLIITLYFRYQPQQFKISPSAESNVVFEVLLGNEYSKSYKDLAERLKGLTVSDRAGVDFSNPYIISPYVKDWKSFLVDYEGPVKLDIPVKFTSPPFPLIALLPPGEKDNENIFSPEILDLADQQLWELTSNKILEEIEGVKDLEKQKLFALTYGEALARSGDFEGAFKQLYLIRENYGEELIGVYAGYFLVLLRSIEENHFIAEYEYRSLEGQINNRSPLAPYFFLSQIETSLASNLLKRLNKLLQRDDIGLPSEIEQRVTIRQADYWYTINQPVKAYAAYNLLKNSTLLPTQPFSYGGFCNTLYEQKKFNEAAKAYRNLASLVEDQEQLGLISYREKMARLKFNEGASLIDDFSQIENAFTGTQGGSLAGIKKFDLLLLQDRKWANISLQGYQDIAKNSSTRNVREEALFKEVVVHHLQGDNETAIEKVQLFLREFLTGNVRISALAFIIDLLPTEIKRLVDNKEYVKALILAKKNKLLFEKSWIDSQFLVDIARAYHNIGIYNEAQKLYLYLLEIMPVDRREEFFLPMIQATFDYGNYGLVEDYAAQYIYNYPTGKFFEEVLFIRLQSLIAAERLEDALKIIPSPLPQDPRFYRLAAMLQFRLDNYPKAQENFLLLQSVAELSPTEQFALAESHYKAENYTKAQRGFELITNDNLFYDQSLFRLAEMARLRGEEKKALTIYTKIVEKGKNSMWKSFAERELQFNNQKDRVQP